MGFAAGTPAHQELLEAALAEAKHLGTHQGNPARAHASTHGHARWASFHDIRRSRTGRERNASRTRKQALLNSFSSLYSRFSNSKISKTQFIKLTKNELQKAYVSNFVAGTRTGPHLRSMSDLYAEISDEDQRWVRSAWSHEMRYFNGFLDDIVKGLSSTEVNRRFRAYADAADSVFDSARVLALPNDVLIFWVLESNNPCPGCRLLRKWSPFPKDLLPTTPKAGATQCLQNCYCLLRIKDALPHEIQAARNRLGSVETLLGNLGKLKRKR
jgi:hypothetical protein